MGDQRIEPGVFRDDMEECFRLLRSYLPDVVGNMKIQCIGPIAGNSDVFGSATKGLHACNEIERELCQRGTNETLYSEVVSLEQCERSEEQRVGKEGVSTCRSWWSSYL